MDRETGYRLPVEDLIARPFFRRPAVVFFFINDCSACKTLQAAVEMDELEALGLDVHVVTFREMCPPDIAAMETLRVRTTPQGRIYLGDRVVTAWEGLAPKATPAEIRTFVFDWASATLGLLREGKKAASA